MFLLPTFEVAAASAEETTLAPLLAALEAVAPVVAVVGALASADDKTLVCPDTTLDAEAPVVAVTGALDSTDESRLAALLDGLTDLDAEEVAAQVAAVGRSDTPTGLQMPRAYLRVACWSALPQALLTQHEMAVMKLLAEQMHLGSKLQLWGIALRTHD